MTDRQLETLEFAIVPIMQYTHRLNRVTSLTRRLQAAYLLSVAKRGERNNVDSTKGKSIDEINSGNRR